MAGRRQETHEALSEHIVRTGLELFAEHGFDEVTVTQVAQAARVAPITVYRHFGSKDGLVFHTRARAVEQLRALAAACPAQDDPRRRVLGVLQRFVAGPQDHELYRLRSTIVARSPRLQRTSLATRVELEQALADGLLQQPGPGDPWRTRVAAAAGLAALHHAVRRWRSASGETLEQVVVDTLQQLWPDVDLASVREP